MESDKKKQIKDYEYDSRSAIGKGSYGEVFLGYKISDPNEPLAVKKVELDDEVSEEIKEKLQKLLKREIQALQSLKHPNIIDFKDHIKTKHNLYIITEYCEGGALSSLKNPSFNRILTVFQQIADAMKYVHSQDYIHRDLKPENILFKEGRVKIVDFGFAKVKQNPNLKAGDTLNIGTTYYMAPEVFSLYINPENAGVDTKSEEKRRYSEKCDVWSAGIILYELLCKQLPWTAKNYNKFLDNVLNIPLAFPADCELDKEIVELVRRMLEKNWEKRPSFEEILQHKVFKKMKNVNPLENYLQYLLNFSLFVRKIAKKLSKQSKKICVAEETCVKLQAIFKKIAFIYLSRVPELLNGEIKFSKKCIFPADITTENIAGLKINYKEKFESYKEKFLKFVKEHKINKFNEKFNQNIISDDNEFNQNSFEEIYNEALKEILGQILASLKKIFEEKNKKSLQLIINLINIRTLEKLKNLFKFEFGEDNETSFEEYYDNLEESDMEELRKTIEKMSSIIIAEQKK